MPGPRDKCQKCSCLCDGDYWKRDENTFLCQECWTESKVFNDKYKKSLNKYKVSRTVLGEFCLLIVCSLLSDVTIALIFVELHFFTETAHLFIYAQT